MKQQLSIIIPYNRDRGYLSQAIKSVERQSAHVKLILAKGDGTCAENLQKGLNQVKTEFYSVLAEDDWISEDFSKRMLITDEIYNELDNIADSSQGTSTADLYYSDAYQMKGNQRKLYRGAYYGHADLLKSTKIHGGAVMYRTESVRKVGGYDTTLTTAEEYDLHLKMSFNNMKFAYVNFPLYFYRIHAENKSKITRANKAEREAYINEIRNRYR